MGRATITESIGDGLYLARSQFDTSAILAEIAQLEVEQWTYWRELNKAFEQRDALRSDRAAALETLNALINQWKQALLNQLQPPPPLTPQDADEDGNNPVTSLPYTDEEREDALENEVVDAVNAARAAQSLALVDKSDFLSSQARTRLRDWTGAPLEQLPDLSSDAYLDLLQRIKDIDDHGQDVYDRHIATANGIIVNHLKEAHAAGQLSSTDVIDGWQKDPATWDSLMASDLTQIGTGYRYAPQSPATHVWAVVAAKITSPDNAAFFAAPAGEALLADVTASSGVDVANSLRDGAPGGSKGSASGGGNWTARWKANTLYGVGSTVKGRRGEKNECLCRCNFYGLSGAQEPRWPGPGMDIGDGAISWTVIAELQTATTKLIDLYYGI